MRRARAVGAKNQMDIDVLKKLQTEIAGGKPDKEGGKAPRKANRAMFQDTELKDIFKDVDKLSKSVTFLY